MSPWTAPVPGTAAGELAFGGSAGHVVDFVMDLMRELDLSAIEQRYHERGRVGRAAVPPGDGGAAVARAGGGVASSRRLGRATYEDVAVLVLTGRQHPDHSRSSEFRKQYVEELVKLFVHVLRVWQKVGLVKLGDVALDGTKVNANASKHKAMSYGWMVRSEAELAGEVKALLERAERVDAEEDARLGRGVRGDEVPEELRRREDRLARIWAAKAELEAETATEGERAKREWLGDDPPVNAAGGGELPRHRVKVTRQGTPHEKAQHNFTDPDSRIMKQQGGCLQGYNGQVAVDETCQIIVVHALTNKAPDVEHLVPMLDLIEDNT